MTREKAEKIVRGIIDKIECNTADIDNWAEFWGFTREEYEEFLDMAIKVTEQEPILDKIKAKIMQLDYDIEDIDYDYNDMAQTEVVHTIYREEVLQIIDKYKAESEEV